MHTKNPTATESASWLKGQIGLWTLEGGFLLGISGFHIPQVMTKVEFQAQETARFKNYFSTDLYQSALNNQAEF